MDVQDQGGTAAITAFSSTQGTGVGANWTFNAGCSSATFVPRNSGSVGSPMIY